MAYCSRCGVELDAKTRRCPLCATPIAHFEDEVEEEPAYPPRGRDPNVSFQSARQARWGVFGILTVLLATSAFVVAGVNWTLDQRLSWSLPPLASLAFAETLLVVGFWIRGLGPVCWGSSSATAFFLWLMELVTHPARPWFLDLALPIDLGTFLAFYSAGLWLTRPGRRGWDVFGILLFVLGVYCVGLDAVVAHGATGIWSLSWSLVVVLSVSPLAGFFLFLHFGLRKSLNLKQIFHL